MINKKCKCINVPSKQTARVQECHILIGHIMCGIVEKNTLMEFCGLSKVVALIPARSGSRVFLTKILKSLAIFLLLHGR